MIQRGEARRRAALLLREMRQRPEADTKSLLNELLFNILSKELGVEEAATFRAENTDWRDRVADGTERSYIVWLASGALNRRADVDRLLLRRCSVLLARTGRGAMIDASALRAAMRGNLQHVDVASALRSDRDIRFWAEALSQSLDEGRLGEQDKQGEIVLEALQGGLLSDVGAVNVDLLRVVMAASLRGGTRGLVTRRQAREWAAQMLYQFDMAQTNNASSEVEAFWELVIREELDTGVAECVRRWSPNWLDVAAPEKFRDFTVKLVRGVLEHRAVIDERIAGAAEHWDVKRIGRVELAIIRLSVFEIVIDKDVPAVVSINEAVELTKRFTPGESAGFVNGTLDRIRRDLVPPTDAG